ncbi:MAG TPA: hypothetical protein VG147_00130 [Solirubrobacteraceae bacterium]|jgi:hypothetical protein|nr:hypothetical protein [Solirubrobacteraceae bacterium]
MPETETPSKDSGKGLSAWVIKAGQLAVALTAVITAAALIWNALKPAPAPAVLVAHVTDVRAHPGITEYTYLQSHPGQLKREESQLRAAAIRNREPPLTQQEIDQALRQSGVEVQWKISLEGPVGRQFKVTHTLFRENAGDKTVIAEGLGSIWPPEHIVSQAGKYENTEGAWTQTPPGGGTYAIEIYLASADGSQNAEGSATFHVAGK